MCVCVCVVLCCVVLCCVVCVRVRVCVCVLTVCVCVCVCVLVDRIIEFLRGYIVRRFEPVLFTESRHTRNSSYYNVYYHYEPCVI